MYTVNIGEAKTHLSRLVQRVAQGEAIIIARAGKPLAKMIPACAPAQERKQRLGFLTGQIRTPADFDQVGSAEIVRQFNSK